MIAAVGFLQGEVREPHVEIALHRAEIDAEFIGQRQRIKLLPLIQLDQNLSESIHKGVVVTGCHISTLKR